MEKCAKEVTTLYPTEIFGGPDWRVSESGKVENIGIYPLTWDERRLSTRRHRFPDTRCITACLSVELGVLKAFYTSTSGTPDEDSVRREQLRRVRPGNYDGDMEDIQVCASSSTSNRTKRSRIE